MASSVPSADFLMDYTITGGALAVKDKVRELLGPDPVSRPVARAVACHRVKTDSTIDSSVWHVLGGLKKILLRANIVWAGAAPELSFAIDLSQLTAFEFDPSINLSFWVEGSALNIEFYKKGATGRSEPTDATTAMAAGAGKLVVRLHLLPDSTSSVTLWVQAVPLTLAELTAKVGQAWRRLTPTRSR